MFELKARPVLQYLPLNLKSTKLGLKESVVLTAYQPKVSSISLVYFSKQVRFYALTSSGVAYQQKLLIGHIKSSLH
jgi:hypothetical protein